jgi:hypothetical protein
LQGDSLLRSTIGFIWEALKEDGWIQWGKLIAVNNICFTRYGLSITRQYFAWDTCWKPKLYHPTLPSAAHSPLAKTW